MIEQNLARLRGEWDAMYPSKVDVEGSNPFSRSTFLADPSIERGQRRSRTVTQTV